ncbi:MAG TPA: GNAT family N-acetyltransferase [Solirubrobacteraceae bacterium]|nr:GNAT family N-acetyltransferase [Solirubrobacteraceae bacterium]
MSSGYRVEALHLGALAPGRALAALADAFAGERLELLVRADAGENLREVERAAREAGLQPVLRQDTYLGDLRDVGRPATRPFTFRDHRDVGPAGTLTALGACWGPAAGPSGKGHAEELEDLLTFAAPGGGEPDDSLWRIAYHDGRLAGVTLAYCQPASPPLGTLLYLGLAPWARGRGLGRALHREALWLLRGAGARVYCDATDVANAPMRRLLREAGCERVGTSTLYASDGRAPAGRAAHPATDPARCPGAPRSLLRVPLRADGGAAGAC